MGRKAIELSAIEVSRLCSDGLHFVGSVPGLIMQVTANEANPSTVTRSWILRVMVGGKRRDMGLGGYPAVTLAGAKEAAREARAKIKKGIDPIEEGRAARSQLAATRAAALTFEQCAVAYIAAKQSEWKNAKHGDQWRNTLATYAYPVIGKMLVRDVTLGHVMRILDPIWAPKTETATRLRGRIESILDWATVRKYRTGENPARWRGHLDKLLAAPEKIAKVTHHEALPYPEIGSFMADLRRREGMGARALEFAILTAARSGETRMATWSEIDIAANVWTVPGERMKAGKEHRVPLSPAAVDLLNALPRFEGVDYLFPNNKGMPLSDMTLTQQLRRMDLTVTAHGFRSTFRDWASECTAFPRDVCEMALAHTIGDKVEAAYRRGELMEKRTLMMTKWAQFCGTLPAPSSVIAIATRSAT
jgi:integrase